MNVFVTLLYFIGGIILVMLILAFFMKKNHFVQREVIINASIQKVFAFLKLLKNQDQFNKWAKADENREWNYKGTDGIVGFIISWNGNKKVGEGEKEILFIEENKRIETQIRFVRPMKTTANVNFELKFISDNQTKVSMSNSGTFNYPMNLFIPLMEKMFPKDMDESLENLKNILEK
jgi:uncharacterized protein YndB with AHSA1/START domain